MNRSSIEKGSDTMESVSTSTIESIEKPTNQQDRFKKIKTIIADLFFRYWFLLGLGIVIGLAWAFPQVGKTNGIIEAQYTVKWGAVILIFLLSGLGLEVSAMLKTILRWRLHLTIQIINFVLLPYLMYGVVRFFIAVHSNLDSSVYKGWMIALSTSTTVSSNSVMTRNANGNDGAAIFNAALGNVLGIFISPALMTSFQNDPLIFEPGSDRGNPEYLHVLKTLGCTVLAPLVVGQIIRFLFSARVKYLATKFKFPIINSLALLCLVWSVFCDGVASDAFDRVTGVDIVAIIFVDIAIYLFGCLVCLYVARLPWPEKYKQYEPKWMDRLRFSRKDAVAIMYCGATKTVSMGIPLINVLYSESSYGVIGVLSLPLLMYHVFQIFIGNFQVAYLKDWIKKDPEDEDQQVPENKTILPTTLFDSTPPPSQP